MIGAATFRLLKLAFMFLLVAQSVIGQSLVIHLDGTNKVSLNATSPLTLGYRVQASADAKNWLDLSDQASGSFTYWIDPRLNRERMFRLRTWPVEGVPITLVM